MVSEEIVNLADYRAAAAEERAACLVVFVAQPYRYKNHVYYITIEDACPDGDWAAKIRNVREDGGIYLELGGWRGTWFLPWPFVAVKIEPMQASDPLIAQPSPRRLRFAISPVSD